jgi:hypothetical protein
VRSVVLTPRPGKCVETVARETYWRQVDACMKAIAREEPAEEMEEEIELLRLFLETADVASIRKQTEALMENGEPVQVVLKRSPGNELVVDIADGHS